MSIKHNEAASLLAVQENPVEYRKGTVWDVNLGGYPDDGGSSAQHAVPRVRRSGGIRRTARLPGRKAKPRMVSPYTVFFRSKINYDIINNNNTKCYQKHRWFYV